MSKPPAQRGRSSEPTLAGLASLFRRFHPLLAVARRPQPLTWVQALLLVGSVTTAVVLVGGTVVRLTDPHRFPDLTTGLWWAMTTVTTVGYGDHVPVTTGGRIVGVVLMIVGIACFAFLTAVAASAIVVSDVEAEEQRIERGESEILRELRELNDRLDRLEKLLDPERRS